MSWSLIIADLRSVAIRNGAFGKLAYFLYDFALFSACERLLGNMSAGEPGIVLAVMTSILPEFPMHANGACVYPVASLLIQVSGQKMPTTKLNRYAVWSFGSCGVLLLDCELNYYSFGKPSKSFDNRRLAMGFERWLANIRQFPRRVAKSDFSLKIELYSAQ